MRTAGIIGVSGYGGGEVLRYLANHPQFQLTYAAGESSAGTQLGERFRWLAPEMAKLTIQAFDAATLPELDVLFASLPTGASKVPLSQIPQETVVVDIGGDHRYADGWTYGLADAWPDRVRESRRIANPGCYPAASLSALAPLLAAGLVNPGPIIIDAKSGVSGAGRGSAGGGGNAFGYGEINENLYAYGLCKHAHVPEIMATVKAIGDRETPVIFTPHLVPMTRGILATCYVHCDASTADCLAAARQFYQGRPFVRVTDTPPQTKWASGTNLAFVSYANVGHGTVVALAAIDNLGKGAAGMAVQNANLACGLEETAGLLLPGVWP